MNRTLLSLTLTANCVGDAGAARLAEALSRVALSEVQIQTRRQLRLERLWPAGLLADRSKSVSPASRRSDKDGTRPTSVRSMADKERSGSKGRDKPGARTSRNEVASKSSREEKGAKKKEEKSDKADKVEKGRKDKSKSALRFDLSCVTA